MTRREGSACVSLGKKDMSVDQSTSTLASVAPKWLVVIAASAGGVDAVRTILKHLPPELPAAIVLVQHRSPDFRDYLDDVLAHETRWSVQVAHPDDSLTKGRVYVARPDSHLTVTPHHTFRYHDGARIRFTRSSANPLFASAARAFGGQVIGIVLTGHGRDATDGVQTVKSYGGIVIAQDPATAAAESMPSSAIGSGAVDYVLPLEAIAPAIERIVRGRPVIEPANQV